MTSHDVAPVAHIVLYGTTAEEIEETLTDVDIGRINEYVANAYLENGVDVDVGLASGSRAQLLSQFDSTLTDALSKSD